MLLTLSVLESIRPIFLVVMLFGWCIPWALTMFFWTYIAFFDTRLSCIWNDGLYVTSVTFRFAVIRARAKIPRMCRFINEVPSGKLTAMLSATPKCTWVQRSLILRWNMMTAFDLISCWFALFYSKKRFRLLRLIHVGCRKNLFTTFDPSSASMRNLTVIIVRGITSMAARTL